MPVYEYHCNHCTRKVSLFYKSYRDYDAATKTCTHCGSPDLTRLISRVGIAKPTLNYAKMDSDAMLSVLEGGDSREVGRMMHELGQDEVVSDPAFNDVTQRLMRGDDPAKIDADIGGSGDV
ncbi:MAG: zinc ribbon domain-containing protein [Chloroflexota bacterium]|nr:zinc ribbon domain-containing protein [Chloroflexota bacterium]